MADAKQFQPEFWLDLMGRELPGLDMQPVHPVVVEGGTVQLDGGFVKHHFGEGAAVGLRAEDRQVVIAVDPGGARAERGPYGVPLSDEVRALLPAGDSVPGMVVKRGERLTIVPISVEEHGPDVLGPRIIDEVRDGSIVRHVVKGLAQRELTPERLAELEELVSAEPLTTDAVRVLADGDDWPGWKTRGDMLGKPAPGDDALRQALEEGIFEGQGDSGSWGDSVVVTAYGILRALQVRVRHDDERLQRACRWLLDWPEPVDRPGMWMTTREHLAEWNGLKSGEVETDDDAYFRVEDHDWEHDLYRGQGPQEAVPTCCRNFPAMCYSRMLHPSGTVATALAACGYADHPRVNDYANTMLQIDHMFGYFCSCWGMVDFDLTMEDRCGAPPDFSAEAEQYETALKALPYGYGRDAEDLLMLAGNPNLPGVHRPDLADTNGWVPYDWKETGVDGHYAVVGGYWQNADCWAKTNRGLSGNAAWPGTIQEFFSLFQARLYQTCLGEWSQGYPSGIFGLIAEVTRGSRERHGIDGTPTLRFARAILLRTVPWLRHNQASDGLWHHEELPHWGRGDLNEAASPRLATYHIMAALNEFGLLDRLRPKG